MTSEWRILTITWNVNRLPPPQSDDFMEKIFSSVRADPSISLLVIGLQEISYMPLTYVASVVRGDDLWTLRFRNFLSKMGYVQMTCSRENTPSLLGVTTLLFIRREQLLAVNRIETKFAKLGYLGYSGHRSAIATRISLQGTKITIINCHFEAHPEHINTRLEQFRMAQTTLTFDDDSSKSYGCIIWLGDLNFRVEIDPSAALSFAQQGDYTTLLSRDQLQLNRLNGKIFQGFSEEQICFPPSYKFIIGTADYDLKRTPSYCDRILWKNVGIADFTQQSYEMAVSVEQSDHRPVLGVFHFKILPLQQPRLVEFLFPCKPGDFWYSNQCNLCRYWFPGRSQPETTATDDANDHSAVTWLESDWIGVYQEDFQADTVPVTWQYVFTSWPSGSESVPIGEAKPEPAEIQSLLFKPTSLLTASHYRLGYFSRSHNCLLAMSETFQVLNDSVEAAVEAEEF